MTQQLVEPTFRPAWNRFPTPHRQVLEGPGAAATLDPRAGRRSTREKIAAGPAEASSTRSGATRASSRTRIAARSSR